MYFLLFAGRSFDSRVHVLVGEPRCDDSRRIDDEGGDVSGVSVVLSAHRPVALLFPSVFADGASQPRDSEAQAVSSRTLRVVTPCMLSLYS